MSVQHGFGRLRTVTPSDSTILSPHEALYVGGTGNIAILGVNDESAVTIESVPAGTILPVKAKKVMSTNTTATKIVALG